MIGVKEEELEKLGPQVYQAIQDLKVFLGQEAIRETEEKMVQGVKKEIEDNLDLLVCQVKMATREYQGKMAQWA